LAQRIFVFLDDDTTFSMRVYDAAATGGLLVELPPDQSSLQGGEDDDPELLRATPTECIVVVRSGKLLCHFCDRWLACTCDALEEAQCRCEPLESRDVCDECLVEGDDDDDDQQTWKDDWLHSSWAP
jgi:hypothetical protein